MTAIPITSRDRSRSRELLRSTHLRTHVCTRACPHTNETANSTPRLTRHARRLDSRQDAPTLIQTRESSEPFPADHSLSPPKVLLHDLLTGLHAHCVGQQVCIRTIVGNILWACVQCIRIWRCTCLRPSVGYILALDDPESDVDEVVPIRWLCHRTSSWDCIGVGQPCFLLQVRVSSPSPVQPGTRHTPHMPAVDASTAHLNGAVRQQSLPDVGGTAALRSPNAMCFSPRLLLPHLICCCSRVYIFLFVTTLETVESTGDWTASWRVCSKLKRWFRSNWKSPRCSSSLVPHVSETRFDGRHC